jgi:hypothetical protein
VSAVPQERGGARVVLPERYRIEHVIGRGGTAVVYAAHDTLLNRSVAIKVFTAPSDSARVLREQQQEAQMLGGLSHHALVTLFDAGIDDADPDQPHIYLVMERIDGPDLGQALRSGALTPLQIAYLGLDLCDALLYVHDRGFLHRDIKPANVLLLGRHSDRRLRGKLSDFGIATVLGSNADDGEFTVGTAAYLSPEQVNGGVLTGESDVYSLGLVLLQAATGRVSFPGTVIESAFARLSRDPEIPDSIPPRLASVLAGMTRRAPADRIPLEQARSELERSLAEQIASDSPPAPVMAAAPVVSPEIADSPPDREFARITGIAARLLRVPAAFVVLGDTRDEASAFVPEAHRTELVALATRALLVDRADGWSVEDVHADPRTAGAIRTAPVRSMAVQPILDAAGGRVGVIAVLDALPREFGVDEAATLADLAQLVGHEVDLRRAVRRALFSREP